MNKIKLYEGTGVYLTWDRLSSESVHHYRIYRADHIDGPYEELEYSDDQEYIEFPVNEYIDLEGTIYNYYKVVELDENDDVIVEHPPQWGEELLLRASIYNEIEPWLNIPVYQEEPLFINDERTIARTASWGPWCYLPAPELFITTSNSSGDRAPLRIIPKLGIENLVTTYDDEGQPETLYEELYWQADYNGHVYFYKLDRTTPVSISWYDRIYINYNFTAFTNKDINDALFLAAGGIVAQQGVSKANYDITTPSSIAKLPRRWDFALVSGATYILLRRLMLMLTQRERRLVFYDPKDQGPDPFNNLQTLANMYKETYEDLKTKIATEKWPDIAVIVTQDFQLPGTRSRFFRLAWGLS